MADGLANDLWHDSVETFIAGLEEIETPEQTASW